MPNGGIQPQTVVRGETVHLIYYQGDPKAGDIFYTRSTDGGATFGPALRVNSQPGSAIAMGTIRGGHLAVGKKGRVFVAWNGSAKALPCNEAAPAEMRQKGAVPMLFARLNDAGDAFEDQRNLMTKTFGLDGGGSVAADEEGRVYVAWHANDKTGQDESARRVFLAISDDEGANFSPEKPVWQEPTGACGCCQLRLMAENGGQIALLYRSATELVNRDTYLVISWDGGQNFVGQKLHDWRIGFCPMSSYALARKGAAILAAWETDGQVYFSPVSENGKPGAMIAAPDTGPNRKHPYLSVNSDGQTLMVWTEGTGWNRGGQLRWQVFDAKNRPIAGENGQGKGISVWSFAAAFARSDGGFTIIY